MVEKIKKNTISRPESKAPRESGIELLRILSAVMVVTLHFNSICFNSAQHGTLNYGVMMMSEAVCICAVNLFIIISGYFMCKTNTRNIMKIIELVCLMLVIREAVCIIQSMYNGGINIRELIVNLIPNDYFVILYCVLFLISPYINRLLDLLDEKELNRLVFRLVVIFGIWNVLVQLLNEFTGREWLGLSTVGYEGSERGFTIVNFIVMYIVGSWIRRNHIDEKINIKQIIIGLIFIYLCLFGWSLGNDYFSQFGIRSAWCYYNPLVQAEAVLVFCLFRKIKFKSKSINYIAGSAFTCYLIHTNILLRFLLVWLLEWQSGRFGFFLPEKCLDSWEKKQRICGIEKTIRLESFMSLL
ncbi:MAG: acyltransferase family protein [Lachnospiraceae bacterium]|nr:acyltransferase family protein [Lachnospiraceae bacterium]MDE6252652.1 acyltransferase family protein [Lachnospiraceae bacterium]